MRDGAYPVVGKDLLIKHFEKKNNSITLQWEPVASGVSKSLDLGYTFGEWELRMNRINQKDTLMYGNYITVWKKQKDGSWKYILDGGNDTPKPEKSLKI